MFNEKLYNNKYHKTDISNNSYLITGGAGFIGSNIVEYLLRNNAGHIRVLDNLSNGYFDNIKDFVGLSNFEFIKGDIRDYEVCKKAIDGVDFISHQAALGSVPRSIKNPIDSNEVNVNGFLNVIDCARQSSKLKKFIYAASSSTYGDSPELPKVEGKEGRPLSPYAVTKLINELYAEVFFRVYGFSSIGLRYFNIFGPKQNPNNPYAAVIPIFCNSFIKGSDIQINGDGLTSRDFTFVENAVQANIKSFESNCSGSEIFNIACGEQTTLNEIVQQLEIISQNNELDIIYKAERFGDVRHSKASIEKAKSQLNYSPLIKFGEGLEIVYNYYLNTENE